VNANTEDAMPRHATQSTDERAQIVLALLRREEPTSLLARRHGISENTLFRWRDAFIAGGTTGLASGKDQGRATAHRLARQQAELAERDRVIGELTIANRVLKKLNGDRS
jgi:transposase-like protein